MRFHLLAVGPPREVSSDSGAWGLAEPLILARISYIVQILVFTRNIAILRIQNLTSAEGETHLIDCVNSTAYSAPLPSITQMRGALLGVPELYRRDRIP